MGSNGAKLIQFGKMSDPIRSCRPFLLSIERFIINNSDWLDYNLNTFL
jgi:hypothetical protein